MNRNIGDKLVKLGPLLSEDSSTLFKWINDPDIVHFNSYYQPVHETNHQAWMASVTKRNDLAIFSIRDENSRLVGTCQLVSINTINRSAELQIRIGNTESRGKGYGTSAVYQLITFGFRDLNLNRIYLHVYEDNIAAIKTYEKNGFKKEGLLMEADFVNGQYKNVVPMAILSKDFKDER